MEKKFVVLKYFKGGGEFHVCDSPKNALAALDELGLCMNWATVIQAGQPKIPILLYQGWMYKKTPERYVLLPFNDDEYFADRFKILLNDIFSPFVFDSVADDVHYSVITITPHPKEKDCFLITINLMFKNKDDNNSVYAEILEALDDVDDSNEEIKGKVFWLD